VGDCRGQRKQRHRERGHITIVRSYDISVRVGRTISYERLGPRSEKSFLSREHTVLIRIDITKLVLPSNVINWKPMQGTSNNGTMGFNFPEGETWTLQEVLIQVKERIRVIKAKRAFNSLKPVWSLKKVSPWKPDWRFRTQMLRQCLLKGPQRSKVRRVRSSRHNFTKETTDKCRKFHFNCKT